MLKLDENSTAAQINDAVNHNTDSIQRLDANVKWLYKYGGSGTGGTSGGGGTIEDRSFEMIVTVDGEQYVLNTITSRSITIYPTKGSHSISVMTRYTNSNHRYISRYRYLPSTSWRNFTLDETNQALLGFDFSTNGEIEIQIYDRDDQESRTIAVKYIVDYVQVSKLTLADQDKTDIITDENAEILMSSYSSLYVKMPFSMIVPGTMTYTVTDIEGAQTSVTVTDDADSPVYIPLCTTVERTEEFLANEDNLGFYEFKVDVEYTPNGSETRQTIEVEPLRVSLIPTSMYVQVLPDSGKVYSSMTDEHTTFYAGYRTFSIKVFNGAPNNEPYQNMVCYITDSSDNEIEGTRKQVQYSFYERTLCTYSTYINETSETPVAYKLHVTFQDGLNAEIHYAFSYFLYVQANPDEFEWYDSAAESIQLDEYFLKGNASTLFNATAPLECKRDDTSYTAEWNLPTATGNSWELMINVGIQFSEINKNDTLIATLVGENIANNIQIYSNSVVIGGNTLSIYIPREDYETYGVNNPSYHLLTLYRRLVRIVGNTYLYEWIVYIDGVIEQPYALYTDINERYYKVIFNDGTPSNFIINHFAINEFKTSNTAHQGTDTYQGLTDMGVVQYWYKYKNSISTSPDENLGRVLNAFKLFDYQYGEDGRMKSWIQVGSSTNDTVMQSIASKAGIPCLLVNINNTSSEDPLTAIPNIYGEEDSGFVYRNCTIEYKPVDSEGFISQDNAVKTSNLADLAVRFILKLQGSSTKGYIPKNFSLAARIDSNEAVAITPLFSPCYNPNDNKSFYPENEWTLKADQVDSAHANNVVCGNFINDYMTPYNDGYRNCLTGFPVLLFLGITDHETGVVNYYVMGIYNFNMGRTSQYNLGHAVKQELGLDASGFVMAGVTSNSLREGFMVAEIANNTAYWDFSQYDDSVLFQGACYADNTLDPSKTLERTPDLDTLYMWGDIKYEDVTKTLDDVRGDIKTLVRSVAETGGALFGAIGKEFSHSCYPSFSDGLNKTYKEKNVVPDFHYQFKRYRTVDASGTIKYGYLAGDAYTPSDSMADSLRKCIYGYENAEGDTIAPILDYKSTVQYYVACMAVGLVDSVQKNMNIKKWYDTWFAAFYDMDTSFGKNNAGRFVSPFAFSDYWEADETGMVTVSRDYWDADSSQLSTGDGANTGYDIPSSYLFAIAKYAQYVKSAYAATNTLEDISTPTEEWSKLRRPGGIFESAQSFMDNYFTKDTKYIAEAVWNINYRYKYLQSSTTGFDTEGLGFFHGKCVYRTKDWLNKRLHVMDAYLNLNRITWNLPEVDQDTIVVEGNSTAEFDSSVQQNPDVIVLRQIFKDGTYTGMKVDGTIASSVKVNEFSPLILVTTNGNSRYLFTDPTQEYSFEQTANGNQNITAYGSDSWVYLDSLNCYISSEEDLAIKSSLIEELSADASGKTAKSWKFTTPSLRKLSLTGKNFTGTLAVYNADNLQELDLTNTSITLAPTDWTTGCNTFTALKTLKVSKVMNSTQDYMFSGTTSLETIEINNAEMKNFTVNPVNNNISIYESKINSVNITGKAEGIKVAIYDDPVIETLNLTNVGELIVRNCPKLARLYISATDPSNNPLRKISVTVSSKNATQGLTIGSVVGIADLTNCNNLESVEFSTTNVIQVKLPLVNGAAAGDNFISIGKSAFTDCTNLQKIVGKVRIDNAEQIFYNCPNLVLDANTSIKFGPDVHSLKEMLYMPYSAGKVDNTTVGKIYNALSSAGLLDSLVSVERAFRNNSITLMSSFFQDSATIRRFPSLTNANDVMSLNPITEVITPSILNFGSSQLTSFDHLIGGYINAWKNINFRIDAFKNMSQLTSISMYGTTVVPYAVNTNGSTGGVITNFYITEFFRYLTALTSIDGLGDFSNGNSNLNNCILIIGNDENEDGILPDSVTSIQNFLSSGLCCNMDYAFSNLSGLTKMAKAFSSVHIVDTSRRDTRGHLYTMFDWSHIFAAGGGTLANLMGDWPASDWTFSRYVTADEFTEIMKAMAGCSSLTYCGGVFINCQIRNYKTDNAYHTFNETDNILTFHKFSVNRINNVLTTMTLSLMNLSLEDSTGFIQFDDNYFDNFIYVTDWSSCFRNMRLGQIRPRWFSNTSRTSRITNMESTFRGCYFFKPYADVRSTKRYYYNVRSLLYPRSKTDGKQLTLTVENLSIPTGWDGNYIIDPTMFDKVTPNTLTLAAMFADSNLFGMMPETLFYGRSEDIGDKQNSQLTKIANPRTQLNVTDMFSGNNVVLVPYLERSFARMHSDKHLYKVNVWCIVPNGTDSQAWLPELSSISGMIASRIIPPNATAAYIKQADLAALDTVTAPYTLSASDYAKIKATDYDSEEYVDIPELNFLHFYNQYSLRTDVNITGCLSNNIIFDNNSSYNWRPELDYTEEYNEYNLRYKCLINARYGGSDGILDYHAASLTDNDNGFVFDANAGNLSASGIIGKNLVSLYYGPIFHKDTKITSDGNPVITTNGNLISEWTRSIDNWRYYGKDTNISRYIAFPRLGSTTTYPVVIEHQNGSTYYAAIWRDQIIGNSNFYSTTVKFGLTS